MDFTKGTRDICRLFSIKGNMSPLVGEAERVDGGFVFNNGELLISSSFEDHPSGVTVRKDRIKNISGRAVSVRSALSKFVLSGGEYQVYTQYSAWCDERCGRWQPLVTEVCASCDEVRASAGATPFVAVYNCQNRHGLAFHILCDSTWRLRVRNFYRQEWQTKNVTVELGINDSDMDIILGDGEELRLPRILYYEFESTLDMDAYKLHRFCNSVYPAKRLPIIYNSWMSKFDNIGYSELSAQLDIAAKLGAEYFVIDAGWFGKPSLWFASVGDWEECTDASMKGRMGEFAQKVRERGLRFGLWFEAERAALTSKAYNSHPEYYIVENGQGFLNFGMDEAADHIFDAVSSQIDKYGIEFIKFDFNASLTYDSQKSSFINYFKGFRKFISRLRQRYPQIYLECCASGGLRMALSNLGDFDSFWMSDDHSLYSQLDIYRNALVRLPSRALEKWVTVCSGEITAYNEEKAERILMSGDAGWGHIEGIKMDYLKGVCVGGPVGISCDLTRLSPGLIDSLRKFLEEYKDERSFWAESECRVLCDTDSLTVLQYNDPRFEEIKIFTFAKRHIQNEVRVYPVIEGEALYEDGEGVLRTSRELAAEGIDIAISKRFSANTARLLKRG